jgi:hypothetical protein
MGPPIIPKIAKQPHPLMNMHPTASPLEKYGSPPPKKNPINTDSKQPSHSTRLSQLSPHKKKKNLKSSFSSSKSKSN